MRLHRFIYTFFVFTYLLSGQTSGTSAGNDPSQLATTLGISFPTNSSSTLILERDGKRYSIDVATRSVQEIVSSSPAKSAATTFKEKCAVCHGPTGHGIPGIGTPDFSNIALQHSLSDSAIFNAIHNGKGGRMPAWSGKLSDAEISSLVSYIRTLSPQVTTQQASTSTPQSTKKPSVYTPGDDVLFSLPTGRPTDRHGVYVNFSHRFPYDPAFSGAGRGGALFGLDGFAIPSLSLRYGITDKLSASISRSPSTIGRPIQLMLAYNLLDESHDAPFNLAVRASIEGQNNFRKNFTENVEAIVSRSITSRAQIYFVPTLSVNARPLAQGGFLDIPDVPGFTTFSLGVGAAVDIRPTVALVAEIIPTFLNARDLGIHRPVYSFGIQKKIWRHAFTFGLTTSPGTTVSQRAGSNAQFLGQPGADTLSNIFLGFDLTRQIH